MGVLSFFFLITMMIEIKLFKINSRFFLFFSISLIRISTIGHVQFVVVSLQHILHFHDLFSCGVADFFISYVVPPICSHLRYQNPRDSDFHLNAYRRKVSKLFVFFISVHFFPFVHLLRYTCFLNYTPVRSIAVG